MHNCSSYLGRILVLIALTTALGLPATSFAEPGGARPARLYLALGDSLAFGVGATDVTQSSTAPSPRLGYVSHLSEFFRGTSHGGVTETVNLAVPGETSETFTNGQLDAALAVVNQPSDVQVVTLDIGGNDLLRLLADPACNPDPTATGCAALVQEALFNFERNYVNILTTLTTGLTSDPGGAQLMVMTAYNPFSGTGNEVYEKVVDQALLGSDPQNGPLADCGGLGDPSQAAKIGLNDMIACIGRDSGATVVDVYPVFEGKGASLTHILNTPPDIHPTNAGYAQIAATFEKAWK